MKTYRLIIPSKNWLTAIVTAALLTFPLALHAAPVQIHFSGTVTAIHGTYTPPISVGEDVSFTYIFDLEETGFDKNGTKTDSQYYDYFYAEQTGGLHILDTGEPDTRRFARRDSYYNQTSIQTGSNYETNDWWSNRESIPDGRYFYIGQYFHGNGGILYPYGSGAYKPYAYVRYDLWIDSISEVPVPGAAWLFGSVVIGLMGYRKKRKCLSV